MLLNVFDCIYFVPLVKYAELIWITYIACFLFLFLQPHTRRQLRGVGSVGSTPASSSQKHSIQTLGILFNGKVRNTFYVYWQKKKFRRPLRKELFFLRILLSSIVKKIKKSPRENHLNLIRNYNQKVINTTKGIWRGQGLREHVKKNCILSGRVS